MKQEIIISEISNIFHSFKSRMSRSLNEQGWPLTATHFKVLTFIEINQPCTGQYVSTHIKRDKAQVTRLLTDLLNTDFISKTLNPEDKRCQNLEITLTGKEMLASLQQCKTQVLGSVFKNIPETQQTKLVDLLQKIQSNLETEI